MADQREIVQELLNRLSTLPPEHQPIIRELALRYNLTPANTPTEEAPSPSGPGFLGVMGDAVMNAPTRFMDFMTGSENPISATLRHASEMGDQATQLWKSGRKSEAVGTALSGLIPGSGDEALLAGRDFGEGNVGGGAAHSLLSLAPFIAGPASRMGNAALEAVPEVASRSGLAIKGAAKALPTAKAAIPAVAGAEMGNLLAGHKGAAVGGALGAIPGIAEGAVKGWNSYVKPLGPPPPGFDSFGVEPGGPIYQLPGPPQSFLDTGIDLGGRVKPKPRTPPIPDWFLKGGVEPGGEPYQLPGPPESFMKSGIEGVQPVTGPIKVHTPQEISAMKPERVTQPGGFVPPVNTWTNANRNLHAVIHQMDLPDSPAGVKAPGMVGKIAKDVFGAKNGAGDLTPDQIDSIAEFLVKNKKWPQKGELR